MSIHKEAILWIQLLGIGIIPLELLFLKLFLAGTSLGPIPFLERSIVIVISIFFPTYLFLKKPADWASMLFLKLPIKGRTIVQNQISSLQSHLIPRLSLIVGSSFLVLIFWQIDTSAFFLSEISIFKNLSRFITLFFAMPILFIITWQWHQLTQSLWLLTRSSKDLEQAEYLTNQQISNQRISLGVGILKISHLIF